MTPQQAAEAYALKRWGAERKYQDARVRDEGCFLAGHAHAMQSAEVLALYRTLRGISNLLKAEAKWPHRQREIDIALAAFEKAKGE